MFMVVVDRKIIAQIMADGHMVPAVQAKLAAFQISNDFPEDICILIKLFLLSGHMVLLSYRKKAT